MSQKEKISSDEGKFFASKLEAFGRFFTKKLLPESYGRKLLSDIKDAVYYEDYATADQLAAELKKSVKDSDKLVAEAIEEHFRRGHSIETEWYKNILNYLLSLLQDQELKKELRMKGREMLTQYRSYQGLSKEEVALVTKQRLETEIKEITETAESQDEKEKSIAKAIVQFARVRLSFDDATQATEEYLTNGELRDEVLVELAHVEIRKHTRQQLETGYGGHRGDGWVKTATVTLPEAEWSRFETFMQEKVSSGGAQRFWIALARNIQFTHKDLTRLLTNVTDSQTKEALMREHAFRFADSIDVKPGFEAELDRYAGEMKTDQEKDQLYVYAVVSFFYKFRYAQNEASLAWGEVVNKYWNKIQDIQKKDETALDIINSFKGMGQYTSGKEGKARVARAREVAEILIAGMQSSLLKSEAQEILDDRSKKTGIR